MALTYQLISSNVLTTATSAITFSSIPATYTDLMLKFSARSTYPSDYSVPVIRFNNDASSVYSYLLLSNNNNSNFAYGSGLTSGNGAADSYVVSNSATASTFGLYEIYIPSYASSSNKISSVLASSPNNSTTSFDLQMRGQQYASATAINRIDISTPSYNFVVGSSFYLYGIKNS